MQPQTVEMLQSTTYNITKIAQEISIKMQFLQTHIKTEQKISEPCY